MDVRDNMAVEVSGLFKKFGDNIAVDAVSFTIQTGSICAMLGPNGAGKTTVINMLATLLKPDSGVAKIFGYDIAKDSHIVRQLIGLTGQFATVDEGLSALDNLTIYGQLVGFSNKVSKKKAMELLEEFDLIEAAKREVSKFSGGMRRRLDLAASLISRPPLIFLDEPTTGLDPRTRIQMWDTIRTLVNTGATVLMTTQYLEEADKLADRIIVIDQGRVVGNDSPGMLKKAVGSLSLHIIVQDLEKAVFAAGIVEKLIGNEAQVSDGGKVTVSLRSTDRLSEILEALKNAEIAIEEINVVKPTLDEVFFALTGMSKTEEDAQHG